MNRLKQALKNCDNVSQINHLKHINEEEGVKLWKEGEDIRVLIEEFGVLLKERIYDIINK